jgi:phosphatidylglycerol---prolipoprotein diacylglyceryl transferase
VQWTGNPRVHLAFEILGFIAGVAVYTAQRAKRGDTLPDSARASVIAGAALGATLGARFLFWLCDPASTLAHIGDAQYLFGGKTVVGGLLGGLIGVELVKKWAGIRRSSGDLFVFPLITAIGIGRIGCFLYGPSDHTAGLPTTLPWGLAIADGVRRHPVALYEVVFLVLLALAIAAARGSSLREGDRFRLFLSSYLFFRLSIDFLKPDPPSVAAGLTTIQWACVAGLTYYGVVHLKRISDAKRDATIRVL